MEQLLLVNPRKRRRKTPKRGAGGRFLKSSSKRRSAPARKRRRRNPVPALARANPVRRARRRNPARVVRRRRRNPISARGFLSQLTQPLMPAIVGAGGAILNDTAFRFIPIPVQFKVGYIGIAARAVSAVGLGMLLSRVIGSRTAGQITSGALTVLAYQTLQPIVAGVLPGGAPAAVGYYGAGAALNGVGEYLSDVPSSLNGPVPDSLREYLSEAQYSGGSGDDY
jgi:hypothetical protein